MERAPEAHLDVLRQGGGQGLRARGHALPQRGDDRGARHAATSRAHLTHISRISPAYLACISRTSPTYLAHISRTSRAYLAHISVQVRATLLLGNGRVRQKLQFGAVPVGQLQMQTVMVRNQTAAEVQLEALPLDPTGPFSLLSALPTLPPHGAQELQVQGDIARYSEI